MFPISPRHRAPFLHYWSSLVEAKIGRESRINTLFPSQGAHFVVGL